VLGLAQPVLGPAWVGLRASWEAGPERGQAGNEAGEREQAWSHRVRER
jgi:hypothetical protein